jgi:hypothetical protein
MDAASDVRVLLPEHKEILLAFARERLSALISDPMDREMRSWTAPWRAEALEHYLKQGWSYGLFSDAEMKGYLLAQPFLFFRGLTQTLWVESVDGVSLDDTLNLIDTAYRWAREKHFQCLLLHGRDDLLEHLGRRWPKASPSDSHLIEIKSTKF